MSIKKMTPMDVYNSLIRNGFKEKLDKNGRPLRVLVFPPKPIGIKLWGMVDFLRNKYNAKFERVGQSFDKAPKQTCPQRVGGTLV